MHIVPKGTEIQYFFKKKKLNHKRTINYILINRSKNPNTLRKASPISSKEKPMTIRGRK